MQKSKTRTGMRSLIPDLKDPICDPLFSTLYQSTDGSEPPSEGDEDGEPEPGRAEEPPASTVIDPQTEEEDNAAGPSMHRVQSRTSKGKGKAAHGDDETSRTWYRRHPSYRSMKVSALCSYL